MVSYSRRALAILRGINKALISSKTETELLDHACRVFVREGGYRLCWIGQALNDPQRTVRPLSQCGFEDHYLERVEISWGDTERGRGPTGTAIRTREAVICQNIPSDPRFTPWREEALKRGYVSSIALPLHSEAGLHGVLNLYSSHANAFTPPETRLLEELAADLAFGIEAIQAKRERQEARERAEQMQLRALQSRIALSALTETAIQPLSMNRQLEVALEIILTVSWLSVQYRGAIFLMDAATGGLTLTAQRGLDSAIRESCARVPLGHCLCGQAARAREVVFAETIDQRHQTSYATIQPHGHYCVPVLQSDRLLGVMTLYVPHGHRWDREEENFLVTAATSLAGLIELRRTERDLAEVRAFASTVLEIAPSLVLALDPDGRILLFNHACQALTGYGEEEVRGRMVWEFLLPADEVAQFQKVFADLLAGRYPLRHVNHWVTREGSVRLLEWHVTAMVNPEGTVRCLVATGLDITERHQAEQRLQFQATHDLLTGLPNRTLFQEFLEKTVAQGRRAASPFALLFIDLDGFKGVNDTHGHEIGDRVLVETARRIQSCLRESDIVARLGGDEFIAILLSLDADEDVGGVARKIIQTVSQPIGTRKGIVGVGASIGISLFPRHGQEADTLIRRADKAMYLVKRDGRNGFGIYNGEVISGRAIL